jgi:methyl-accepting chemotaxis protein
MVTTMGAPELSIDATLIAWLDRVRSRRDFSVPLELPVLDGEAASRAEAVRALVAAGAARLAAFRRLIDEADGALAQNAEQIVQACAGSERYRSLVFSASTTLEEMSRLSADGATHAAQLNDGTQRAIAAVQATAKLLLDNENDGRGANALGTVIKEVDASSRALQSASKGLLTFVNGVARISRQAALLSTNARIEAAHLGQTGKGFAIVANEVRTLADSTKEAVTDIGQIARLLAEATQRAVNSTSQALAAASDLASTRDRITEGVAVLREAAMGFDLPVQSIAAMTEEHQAALPGIVASFEEVKASAQGVATSAQDAAQVDLVAQFGRVRSILAQFTFGPAIAAGNGAPPVTSFEGDLARAVRDFEAALVAAERDVLDTIMHGAVGVARNGYLWNAIAARSRDLKATLEQNLSMLKESRNSSRLLVDLSHTMRDIAQNLRASTDVVVQTMRVSAGIIDRVRGNVESVGEVVGEMSSALDRAGTILALVDEISAETNLLALNAAIEAAHAGEAGLGFSVIAGEIRKLADGTHTATNEVGRTIDEVANAGEAIRTGTDGAIEYTHSVESRGYNVRDAVVDLIARMSDAVDQSLGLAILAEEQMHSYDHLIAEVSTALGVIESDTAGATDGSRLELAEIGHRAFALAGTRKLGIFAERMRAVGFEVATEMDAALDAAVDGGMVTLQELHDTEYELVSGARVADLSRLFDVSRVPPEGFDPPKFATRYDRAIESGIDAIIDAWVARDPAIKSMVAVDINGFCFGHHRDCRRDWTGEAAQDLAHNRIKRFFEDALSLRCARTGLHGGANALPARSSYEDFTRAGCTLDRVHGERPWGVYTYTRDTGVVYNDLSLAIYAKNKRVGTVRIIYDADTL